jgi:hypothetical protein
MPFVVVTGGLEAKVKLLPETDQFATPEESK